MLYRIMDRLDVEDDDNVRAGLIDEAIGLTERSRACADAWKAYKG